MSKKSGLQLVLERNVFYRDNYRLAVVVLLLLIVINGLLGVGIYYRITHPPKPQYFATNGEGRMINWHPLTDPVVPDDFVLQWTTNAVRKTFSLDYLHFRGQLQDAMGSYTKSGWQDFINALKKSNNLKTLEGLKMVANAQVTAAPSIVRKAIVNGRYAWVVRLPLLITYSNAQRNIPMPMVVTVVVIRMPVQQDPARIAINNFLPEVQQG